MLTVLTAELHQLNLSSLASRFLGRKREATSEFLTLLPFACRRESFSMRFARFVGGIFYEKEPRLYYRDYPIQHIYGGKFFAQNI